MTLCMDSLDVRLAPTAPPRWLHAESVRPGDTVRLPEWPEPRRVRAVHVALDGTLDLTFAKGDPANVHGWRRLRIG